MHKNNQGLRFSPSDLTRFMESPFASWMDRYALEFPAQVPARDAEDPLMVALQQKGYAREATLEAGFVEQGLQLVRIEGQSAEEKAAKTLAAIQSGCDVIAQARLEGGSFSGFADLLIKRPGTSRLGVYHYEVWDSKLSRQTRPAFVIQLCCYVDLLQSIQGMRAEHIAVALGNGDVEYLKTCDFYYYYQSLKSAFLSFQDGFDADSPPDPADSGSWGDWSGYAEQLLTEKDHLFQVATITRSQIKKLNRAGIATMQALVDSDLDYVPGVHSDVLQRLKAQAEIQKRSQGNPIPAFTILQPGEQARAGLALLPPHSPLDVFFDIEGYPLDEGGLEYLWGCTYFDESGERTFRDFWAHDPAQEKVAFEAFIQWVYARWQQDPAMHIYHYANYEIAACKKLMGRYGVCEYEVDQLLRNGVFVDLYKIVQGGLLLGEPRYSIKNVEHLYRGQRETAVGSGGDSVVVYEQWRERYLAGEEGGDWQASAILANIRDYNIDDCNSTQELVDWLRKQQQEHSIVYLGNTDVIEPEEKEEISARTQLRDRLLQKAESERASSPVDAALTENLAWSLEFHRRESKPVFWRLFERMDSTEMELTDDLDCLAGCERTDRPAFKQTPRKKKEVFEYRFDPAQAFKGTQKSFYLLGEETEDGKRQKVDFVQSESNLEYGLLAVESTQPPPARITLVPDEYVGAKPIPEAIDQVVTDFELGRLQPGSSAILDFLSRSKPRIKGHGGGPIAPKGGTTDRLQQIIDVVSRLDNSYLTIQGPPGAGKSYTGKHIIAELVQSGARIGITSNSHKAINNLLLSTARHCREQGIAATFCCTRDGEPELAEYDVAILSNNQLAGRVEPGCVLGTTAWGFARDDMTGQLDYLFVDEAGQVAVANLIGMSRAARNLILMGDQMQLGQPSQASHPAESGLSILDYLLHETPTIPEDMGVFLGTTYRMHSQVNRLISEQIYDGRLSAHPSNDQRTVAVPPDYRESLNREAGVVFVPVAHEGNTQASDEEVEKIAALATELLGRTFHTGNSSNPTRLIDWNDMLFVAPYNHQVSKLRAALGDLARIGSVDKFQGQEAPIVFLSMCASNAGDSPRGLDFLFDRHRLNVAISRAQSLAIVVANPGLGLTSVSNVKQLRLVNLFNAIVAEGSSGSCFER